MAKWCDASKIDWKKRYKMKKKPRGYGRMIHEKRVKEWLNTKEITDTECMERQHIKVGLK